MFRIPALGLAVLLMGCHGVDVVRARPTDGGHGGGGSAVGGGGAPTEGSASIPSGAWGDVGWDSPCSLEVTAGPHPDVPSLTWTSCGDRCRLWRPTDFPDLRIGAAQVVVTPQGGYVGASLFELVGMPRIAVVWDLSSGDPVLAWRSSSAHCTPLAVPTEDFTWLTVQRLTDTHEQIYLEHDYHGGGYRLIDLEWVGPRLDGNERFLVLGESRTWDRQSGEVVAELSGREPSLVGDRIFFRQDRSAPSAWGGHRWTPGTGSSPALIVDQSETLLDLRASETRLVWLVADYDYPTNPYDGPARVWTTSLPQPQWPVIGKEVATLPIGGIGRTSDRFYVIGHDYTDTALQVVDISTGEVSELAIPDGAQVQGVTFVGDDHLSDGEAVWFTAFDRIYRVQLP